MSINIYANSSTIVTISGELNHVAIEQMRQQKESEKKIAFTVINYCIFPYLTFDV